MTQTTVLAAGTTAATSSDIVVAAGAFVTVGLFSAAAAALPEGVMFAVDQDTPGADNTPEYLHQHKRTAVLSGPGTFRVKRPVLPVAFGVFTEA
jgi:hypothetical protein